MASYQTRGGKCPETFERISSEEMDDGSESEAKFDVRRHDGIQSNLARLHTPISALQNASGFQYQCQKLFHLESLSASTSKARNQNFDRHTEESGNEALVPANQYGYKRRRRKEIQELRVSDLAHGYGQHRQPPTTAHTVFDRGFPHHGPQPKVYEWHQARQRPSKSREQALKISQMNDHPGTYWKPAPGAGCQKAPHVGGSRGFNPSGTVPEYGGLEIWYDDDGEIVERRGWGGKDDGSFGT